MDRIIKKKTFKKNFKIMIVIILSGTIFFLFKTNIIKFTPSYKVKKSEIIMSTVKKVPISQTILVIGKVEPDKSVIIESLESGEINEILVNDGSYIEKGETILSLFNEDLNLEYNQLLVELSSKKQMFILSNNQYKSGEIELKETLFELDYQIAILEDRLETEIKLFESKSIAKQTVLESERELEYLLGKKEILIHKVEKSEILQKSREDLISIEINSINNQLSFLNKRVNRLNVKASCSGLLNLEKIEVGQFIPDRGRVATIDDNKNYKLEAFVDEFYIPQINLDDIAIYKIDNKEYRAKVVFISPEVINSKVKLDFEPVESIPGNIKSGQNLNLKIINSEIAERVVIDNGNFYKDSNGSWIFRIEESGVDKVLIKTGIKNRDYIEILDGLEVGDRVIVSSYKKYKDYEKLIIEEF